MAEFRNVSGQDRHLALPDWVAPRLVVAGGTVVVDDEVAQKYAFDQAGVWEDVNASSAGSAAPAPDPVAAPAEAPAAANPSDGE